ncbi:Alpha/Beta hydrolase protein [Aspergillus oleicola]
MPTGVTIDISTATPPSLPPRKDESYSATLRPLETLRRVDVLSTTSMPQSNLPPWETLPPCPGLPPSGLQHSGLLTLPRGISLWHAIYGVPVQISLKNGTPPVVFLTGGLSHSGYYGHQVQHLANGGTHTVIVFDHRGHGRTPLGTDTELTYDKLEQDLIDLLDHYGIPKAALIGWSDGAMVAWTALRNHHHRVDRVFAFAAIDDCEKNDGDRVDQQDRVKALFARCMAEWAELKPREEGIDRQDADSMANFLPYFRLWKREPKWTAEMFAHVPVRWEADAEDAPVVWVVVADHDDWIPEAVNQRLRGFIRNSSYLVIPNGGHLAFIQTPAVFSDLVTHFLEDGRDVHE